MGVFRPLELALFSLDPLSMEAFLNPPPRRRGPRVMLPEPADRASIELDAVEASLEASNLDLVTWDCLTQSPWLIRCRRSLLQV